MNAPIIIIGAGATGLMAGMELSAAGHAVILLAAAAEPGGRMHTFQEKGFSAPVETGAEFVHGHLPLTLGLLDAAGIAYRPVRGRMQRVFQGKWVKEDWFDGDWDELMETMGSLASDMSVTAFLATHFPGERYAQLRNSVQRFAEGYDLADVDKASTLALYEEWQEEGGKEYRVDGGYGRMVHYMAGRCREAGAQLICNSPVTGIEWQQGRVTVSVAGGGYFTGSHAILTVSLGVWQQDPCPIRFTPVLPDPHLQTLRSLGFGSVIKIIAQFRAPFWAEKGHDLGFILSDEPVPTWWTQYPDEHHILTGWLAASAMRHFQTLDEAGRLAVCMDSLAAIFGMEPSLIRDQLEAFHVYDWSQAPYIRGGYSYETVGGSDALKRLQTPIANTLYFAGEALYTGSSPATVEAALFSGKEVAGKINVLLETKAQ